MSFPLRTGWELFFPLFFLCKSFSVYIGDGVCYGLLDVGRLLISTYVGWVSPMLGLCKVAIIFMVSLGCWCTLVLGCCWVVLAMLGPRKTLKHCWPELCFTLWFGVVTLLTSSSSQSRELFVLLQYAVVGLWTVESRMRGWVCLRKLVFEVISLAFSLS